MINVPCTGVLLGPVTMAVCLAAVHLPHFATFTGLSVDTLPTFNVFLMVLILAFWGCGDTDLVSGCLHMLSPITFLLNQPLFTFTVIINT